MGLLSYNQYVRQVPKELTDTVIDGTRVARFINGDDSTAVYYKHPSNIVTVSSNGTVEKYRQSSPSAESKLIKYEDFQMDPSEKERMLERAFGKDGQNNIDQKEEGGILSQAPKELVDLVQAAMSDESAAKKLSQLMSQRPDLADMIEQIAAELQGAQSMKCGGSVKKKQTGDRINRKKVMAKGGCSCVLKKVGGKLIEVDSCTGLPIHRNGGNVVEVDQERVPVHKVGGEVQKFEDGKTIWQKWWNKITEKPPTFAEARLGKTLIAFNDMETTPYYDYIGDPLMQDVWDRVKAYEVDGYLPEDGKVWYRQYPTGSVSTLATDRRLNAQFDENNRKKEFEESLQDPSMLPGETQVMREAMARNAEYDAQQAALKKQQQQKAQAAQAQRVRTFYSKMSDSDKRELQDMLKSAGYYKGEIDGLVGKGTVSAVRKFQQDNKLTVDGMAGKKTLDVLRDKTRQVAQPVTDLTVVPGYTQAMQLLNQMNSSVSAVPVKTGSPTGGMGLNDVLQGRPVELVVMPVVNYGQPDLGLISTRKQGGRLNYANYLN